MPHAAAAVPVWHWLPAQQPVAQLVASQMHIPPEHRCPTPQAAPAPQLQVPFTQLLAVVALQAVQTTPAGAHLAVEVETHELFSQQPLGQLVASQTHAPFMHRWPVAQALPVPHLQEPAVQRSDAWLWQEMQTAPEVPHAVSLGVWHTPLKQHPAGQFVGSQPVHVALWH